VDAAVTLGAVGLVAALTALTAAAAAATDAGWEAFDRALMRSAILPPDGTAATGAAAGT